MGHVTAAATGCGGRWEGLGKEDSVHNALHHFYPEVQISYMLLSEGSCREYSAWLEVGCRGAF